jgi:hypothetical protein
LHVEGEIDGGAVVVGGAVDLGPRARIQGEAIALGGQVQSAPGAEVQGGVVGLSILPRPLASGADWRRTQRLAALVGDAVGCGVLLAWTALVVLLWRGRAERARSWLAAAPWRTTGLGILSLTGGLFAVVMGIVLLAITLVGLPLSLMLAFCTVLLLLVALALGVTRIGDVVCEVIGWRSSSRLPAVLVGVLAVCLPQLAADVVRLSDWGAGGGLRGLHATLVVFALAAGLGALVLSRLGRSDYSSAEPLPGSAGLEPASAPRL